MFSWFQLILRKIISGHIASIDEVSIDEIVTRITKAYVLTRHVQKSENSQFSKTFLSSFERGPKRILASLI